MNLIFKDSQESNQKPNCALKIFPLYANLATEKQRNVFQIPDEDTRHCIISTNVAETSITIPNIKYVIDTGKVKQRLYDEQSSATTFEYIL